MGTPILFIPKTSPQRYISGIVALNIRDPLRVTGDWHSTIVLAPGRLPLSSYVFGDGMEINTNAIWGTREIIDGTQLFYNYYYEPANTPVWMARHCRACADLIYSKVLPTGALGLIMLKEWFHDDDDQKEVLDLLEILRPKLDDKKRRILDAWVVKNTTGSY